MFSTPFAKHAFAPLFLALAGLTACTSRFDRPMPDRREMILVVVTDDGLGLDSEIRIGAGGSVGWLHEADPEAPVDVEVHYEHGGCESCATTMPFEVVGKSTKTKRSLAHSQMAAMSFTQPGSFDFDVAVADNIYRGRVIVTPRPQR